MPVKKISELTELAAVPASGDLAVIVDVSDTTMAGSGTDKKITAANLLGPTLVVAGSATHLIVASDMTHDCTLKITADYGGGGYCRLPALANAPSAGTVWNVIVVSSAEGESPFIEFQKKSTALIQQMYTSPTTSSIGYPILARLTYLGSDVWCFKFAYGGVATERTVINAD